MGLFKRLKSSSLSWEEKNTYTGETPPCPVCGEPLVKRYVFSAMYCANCRYGLDYDLDYEDDDETLSVWDAAEIWASHGKDEDYTFGYSEDELEEALND